MTVNWSFGKTNVQIQEMITIFTQQPTTDTAFINTVHNLLWHNSNALQKQGPWWQMKTYDTVSNWLMWYLISYIICSKIKSFGFSLKNEKDDHQGWNSEKN